MVEEKLMEVFSGGESRLPARVHRPGGDSGRGLSHLTESDYMATTHRGHGHALAKGIDLKRFMAELFGRRRRPLPRSFRFDAPGRCRPGDYRCQRHRGRRDPDRRRCGVRRQVKKKRAGDRLLFGEGATGEGTFHESLNLAALMRLPIVFVCENNRWAEFTPQAMHMPIRNVADRATAYDIPGKTLANDF